MRQPATCPRSHTSTPALLAKTRVSQTTITRTQIFATAKSLPQLHLPRSNNRTCLAQNRAVINYDEWGGFFDHVPPAPGPVTEAERTLGTPMGCAVFAL